MPYDPVLVQPMRDDMTSMQVEELLDAAAERARDGGVAAGRRRPRWRRSRSWA